ncbi:MAG: lipid II flippase MurJ, partial [Acidiferrobacteraceae bacterium]
TAGSGRTHSLAAAIYPLGFLYAGLSLVAALLGGFLAAAGNFLLPALASNLIVLAPVIALVLAGNSLGVMALPVGLLVAATGQLACLLLAARREGLRLRLPTLGAMRQMATMLADAGALVFAALPVLPMPVLERHFGAQIGPGTVSHIFYASKLVSATVRVFATAINSMGLSLMSAYLAAGQNERFDRLFNACFRMGLYMAVVAIVGFSIEGGPILRLVLQRGAFASADTVAVAAILQRYALYLLYGLAFPAVSAGLIASGAARRLIFPNFCGFIWYVAAASLAASRRDPDLLALAYGGSFTIIVALSAYTAIRSGIVKGKDISDACLRASMGGLTIGLTMLVGHFVARALGLVPIVEVAVCGTLGGAALAVAVRLIDPEAYALAMALGKRVLTIGQVRTRPSPEP